MSRPVSRNSKRGSAKSPKVKKKTPKQQIAELTEQNTTLTTELEALKLEANQMRNKIDVVTRKIVTSVKLSDFKVSPQAESDIYLINEPVLVDMIESLRVKKKIYDMSTEARADQLEQQVTRMNMDMAKLVTKNEAYEVGLGELEKYSDINQMKDKISNLKIIAAREYHTFSANDSTRPLSESIKQFYDGANPKPHVQNTLENAHLLTLIPNKPQRKLPGETLVKKMQEEFRLFVVQELSPEKGSGGDWRRFAERIGISEETIQKWRSLKLPMGHVLNWWDDFPDATVRMLHRHLSSPQMRCTVVAKLISDFYDVE